MLPPLQGNLHGGILSQRTCLCISLPLGADCRNQFLTCDNCRRAPQAICIAACYPEDWPLLIICPSALRLQWADALAAWAPPALLPPPKHIAVVAAAKVIGFRAQGNTQYFTPKPLSDCPLT